MRAALFVILLALLPGCAHVAECTAAAMAAHPDLEMQVCAALRDSQRDGGAALDKLYSAWPSIVLCIVSKIAADFVQPQEAWQINAERQELAQLARAWLESRGLQTRSAP